MAALNRMIINICSGNLLATRDFYTRLFDFHLKYDSDWFIHLESVDKNFELGIIDQESEVLPKDFRNEPGGIYLPFVVNDVEEVYQKAITMESEILREPADTSYGQRRLLLKDPTGTVIDVPSPMKNPL